MHKSSSSLRHQVLVPEAPVMFSLIWTFHFLFMYSFFFTWNLLSVCKSKKKKKSPPFFCIYQTSSKWLLVQRMQRSIILLYVSTTWRASQFSGGMAGKKKKKKKNGLLGADSDGWGSVWSHRLSVKHTLHLSLSSRCPLRSISRCSITRWHIGGEEGGTHGAGQPR